MYSTCIPRRGTPSSISQVQTSPSSLGASSGFSSTPTVCAYGRSASPVTDDGNDLQLPWPPENLWSSRNLVSQVFVSNIPTAYDQIEVVWENLICIYQRTSQVSTHPGYSKPSRRNMRKSVLPVASTALTNSVSGWALIFRRKH